MNIKMKKVLFVILTFTILVLTLVPNIYVEAASNHLLIINTKTNKMGYYVNNKLVKEFKVATGKKSTPTPTGKSKIVNKIKNRPYYSGGIPGGDPRNPLGDRWLGLHIKGTYGTTYGIHGNNNESSIGKHISGGCIRMHNKDVRWLFDQIPNKSDVILKYTDKSFIQIAKEYGITLQDKETVKTGWKTENGKKYYYNSKGEKVKGWQTINNNKYYFDNNGVMQTGFKQINSQTYYLGTDGIMKKGWQTINNNKYYFDNNGVMQKGFKQINGQTYYLGTDGIVKKGWQIIDGKKYYFDNEGKMAVGIKVIDSTTYYFDNNGQLGSGWQSDKYYKYYFNSEGIALIGWQEIDGKTYYFNKDGTMQQRWETLDGNIYYFNKDGSMQKGWATINNNKYYFGEDGKVRIGLQNIEGNNYYFYEDGKMAVNTVVEDGIVVDENGIATQE